METKFLFEAVVVKDEINTLKMQTSATQKLKMFNKCELLLLSFIILRVLAS